MASPNGRDRLVSTLDWCGRLVQTLVYDSWPTSAQILDVGTGWGKYRDLLPDYGNMDACEIWEPYIERELLADRYRSLYAEDVRVLVDVDDLPEYDIVIMGDVLEHLPRDHAQYVVRRMIGRWHGVELLVIVPYLYPQDEEDGNPYEIHIQDDLTPEMMAHGYPELRLIALETRDNEPFKGLYRRNR